jgi:hypothetical protein
VGLTLSHFTLRLRQASQAKCRVVELVCGVAVTVALLSLDVMGKLCVLLAGVIIALIGVVVDEMLGVVGSKELVTMVSPVVHRRFDAGCSDVGRERRTALESGCIAATVSRFRDIMLYL